MRFAYLRDPLFLCSLSAYAINRWLVKPNVAHGFFHSHFNDLLCIPFLVPPMLYVARLLRLRSHDRAPLIHEIIVPFFVWSILFEFVYPALPFWNRWVTRDHRDILYYALGASVAAVFWGERYARDPAPGAVDESAIRDSRA